MTDPTEVAEELESESANRRASRGDTDDRDGDDGVE